MRLRVRGFNIVELMVAMVAGLLLAAAVTSLFATILKANQTTMQVSRLNQELQSITDMIARDIQRAGYDSQATTWLGAVSGASEFKFDADNDLMGEISPGSKVYRCVRVRYDEDGNGVLDDSETHIYGYSSAAKAVRLVDGSVSLPCDLSADTFLVSTDNTIEISDLRFSLLASSVSTGTRTIMLSLAGQYKANSALSLTLQRDIKLRNDGY